MLRLALHVLLSALIFLFFASSSLAADDSAEQIFQRRIMPIFKSPKPSSCTQCHLGGVDLKDYILPSYETTFRSLRDQGLVDLKQPENSKILKLIKMRESDNPGADLIHAQTRQAEYEAFAAWLKQCASDSKLVNSPPLASKDRAAARPNEVIRHGRKDRLLESFEHNIWAMRFRCMSCHIEGSKENDKLRLEHGDRVAWMKKEGPAATMAYLIDSELIDKNRPEDSMLLKKPLMAVKHGGGKKFLVGDQGYQAFRTWLEDYGKILKDEYPSAASLPKKDTSQVRFGSEIWIKLTGTSPAWGDSLLQVDVYAWDSARSAWDAEPIASTDRPNFAKGRLWQHTLTLIAATNSPQAQAWKNGQPSLPQGKYLVKVYVDQKGRAAQDWTSTREMADYVGQAEVHANWETGYSRMTVIDASQLQP